ncbi:hypothetical protein AYO41_02160 [Verrucomicrobia bacterium SCGC AG-212-E04]|nr:hypothetical protein AYO41_02160 [Verrucomicrobia bacterium SCGC AG-212-E04]
MPRILIIGAGYVGEAFAEFAHAQGCELLACTATPESARALAATKLYPVLACDVSNREQVGRARSEHGEFDLVVFCASSGRGGADRYRTVYLEGARNLSAAFPKSHLLYTGSTSVYAQTDGSWVDEISAAEPDRDTGKILLETEQVVRAAGGTVARLAGIYGPGRSVLLRRFLAGRAVLEGDGLRWINQAHRDDIVQALWCLGVSRTSPGGGIFNVCDDCPLTQRECYEHLATKFQRPLPPVALPDYDRKRGWTNKRVANARLRELGWSPRFPSFLDAVDAGINPGLGTTADSA